MSLSIAMPNASESCCAIRRQPHRGLRRFISTMALISSGAGPFGRGLPRRLRVNSSRYLRLTRARWNLKIVEGLSTLAERASRTGRINTAHNPAMTLSIGRRLGARPRRRLRINNWCFTSNDSAITALTPPGPRSFAMEAMRWINRMASSRTKKS